jgi:large subunit ribosomal protein L10
MDATSLDEVAFKSIAKLPGREVLNGQLAGVVASPLTGLVRGLGSMIQGLAIQLGQIAEKGLVSGTAEAAGPVSDESSAPTGADDSSSPPAAEADTGDEKAETSEEETSDSNEEEG